MDFIEAARLVVGPGQVLTGSDMARFSRDMTGKYTSAPLCVLRPGSTEEVAALLSLATRHMQPIVPVSGNTGVSGGTFCDGAAMLSLERMNRVLEVKHIEGNLYISSAAMESREAFDRLWKSLESRVGLHRGYRY